MLEAAAHAEQRAHDTQKTRRLSAWFQSSPWSCRSSLLTRKSLCRWMMGKHRVSSPLYMVQAHSLIYKPQQSLDHYEAARGLSRIQGHLTMTSSPCSTPKTMPYHTPHAPGPEVE